MKTCPVCDTPYPNQHNTCPTDGAVLIESRELAPGYIVRGKYRIVSKLGQGGMGVVYLAEHLMLGGKVALKFLAVELSRNPQFVKRFRNEARAAYQLRHPNIVEVTDLDQDEDGSLFIAMEYVAGPNLRSVLREAKGPLPVARALHIARGVAAGLAAAHARGAVHRDIKPENILLRVEPDVAEQAKVLDFGIAVMTESVTNISRTQGLMLTPQYAAPEQWRGTPATELDGRTDLYALGGLLYEMLAGRTPFGADNPGEWMFQHLQGVPEPLGRLRPDLATDYPGLEALVMRLLARERELRFPSATALLEALAAKPPAPHPAPDVRPALTPHPAAVAEPSGKAATESTALLEALVARPPAPHPLALLRGITGTDEMPPALGEPPKTLASVEPLRGQPTLTATERLEPLKRDSNEAPSCSDTDRHTPRIASGSSAAVRTLVKPPESKPTDLQPEVDRVEQRLELIDANVFLKLPRLRGVLLFVTGSLLLIPVLSYFNRMPRELSGWRKGEIKKVEHSDLPLVATERKADDFSEDSKALSKEKWSIGKGWQLVPEPTSHPGSYYPALSIVGTDIGYLLPPNANTQYYDFTEDFQVLIFAPAVQDSFTWLIRLRQARTGKYSYYRFTFDFPDKSTKTGKVSACLVVDDIFSRRLDAQEAAQLQFKGTFSAAPGAPSLLQITTVAETQPAGGGVKFTVKLRYNDLSRPFDSPEYITPELRQREFVDYKNELKWGTVGFTAPAHGSEAKIMAFSLTPLLPGGKQ